MEPAKCVQVKSSDNRIVLIRHGLNPEEKQPDRPNENMIWRLNVEEATSLLNGDALRNAIAEATARDREARRHEIDRLKARIAELEALDRPIPNPNAPAVRIGTKK